MLYIPIYIFLLIGINKTCWWYKNLSQFKFSFENRSQFKMLQTVTNKFSIQSFWHYPKFVAESYQTALYSIFFFNRHIYVCCSSGCFEKRARREGEIATLHSTLKKKNLFKYYDWKLSKSYKCMDFDGFNCCSTITHILC